MTDTHHHHLPDDSIVFHSHDEHYGTAHFMVIAFGSSEDTLKFGRSSSGDKPTQECGERTCAMRRHDDS